MVYPITRLTFFPFLRLFIKKITGLENVPKKGPYIIVCKHLGALDGFFLAAVIIPHLKIKVNFVASVKRWGYIWEKLVAQKWAAVIQFYANDPGRCLADSRRYLENGQVIGLFPEGYLYDYKRNSRAKTGAARLALWTKVPIVPVGFNYDITVKNHVPVLYQFWKAVRNVFKNPHSLEINFGMPFELNEFYNKEITKDVLLDATQVIMDKIATLTKVNNINS